MPSNSPLRIRPLSVSSSLCREYPPLLRWLGLLSCLVANILCVTVLQIRSTVCIVEGQVHVAWPSHFEIKPGVGSLLPLGDGEIDCRRLWENYFDVEKGLNCLHGLLILEAMSGMFRDAWDGFILDREEILGCGCVTKEGRGLLCCRISLFTGWVTWLSVWSLEREILILLFN